MFGLSVRWSLTSAPAGALEKLRAYVEDESFTRFASLSGLRFKTWRAREGEWFEGTYVFVSAQARQEFQDEFVAGAEQAPATRVLGVPPVVEPFEVVAVVRGPAGFRSAPRFEQ
ncbi:hypothetical protein D9V41_15110 [Aeromicrobium phragmitis]|uniref:ABM domain-containing protein n=1 Tax=Aeromicrobium phragmitis TaxID=2478914 RepID=A0A3L8PHX5_9ACTN|nr:hypothetical protein [Aeromicrobium phragmitis]RLV54650.1 hypothetical protein D9V41_15110 [Aeromicrobium phragmitis]